LKAKGHFEVNPSKESFESAYALARAYLFQHGCQLSTGRVLGHKDGGTRRVRRDVVTQLGALNHHDLPSQNVTFAPCVRAAAARILAPSPSQPLCRHMPCYTDSERSESEGNSVRGGTKLWA
jgi:hypothetical protein